MTMRILHFSDIHLGVFPSGLSWLFDKRILGTATQFLRRRPKQDFSTIPKLIGLAKEIAPDLILCTGDITATANPAEFNAACDALTPLARIRGADFLYIPGNHDAYTARSDAAAARQAAIDALNTLKPNPTCNDISLGGARLFLLDAAVPMPPWRSAGSAPTQALQALETALREPRKDGEPRILISHFPIFSPAGGRIPWRRRMDGDILVRRLVKQRLLDLVLCGHIHTPFTYAENDGAFTQVCPGSLTLHHHVAVVDIAPNNTISSRLIDINSPKQPKETT